MTGLAAVLRDQGKLSQAKALYECILAQAPRDQDALNGLAGMLYDLGDREAAKRYFQHRGKEQQGYRQE